jgi:AraC-like DNA-binding protein
MPNVEWLLHEAASQKTLQVSTVTSLDNETWHANFERLAVGPGLMIFLTSVEARREVMVEARDDKSYPWMGSQVTVAGRADIDFCDGRTTYATPNQALLFRPSQRRAQYRLAAGQKFHSAGYNLCVRRVERLFDDHVPDILHPLLAGEAVESTRILPMTGTRMMRSLATSLFAKGFNGPLRILMMEGAVLQLLAAQASAGEKPKKSAPVLSSRDRDRIHAARERLIADMREPPTLGTLAADVGLTEKRLNAGFRAVFGATVFETLRKERLDHARHALATENVPLKDVSHRVGYNHVTNFINAFTAQFGASPRKYGPRRLD